MVPGPRARLASRAVHLKTPLALSLALLLGTTSGPTEAAPRRGSSTSARKTKKAPRTEQAAPAPETAPAPEAAPAPAEAPKDVPVEAQAPAPAAPVEPTPAPQAPPPPPAAWAGRVAVLAVPADRGSSESAVRIETELREALGGRADVRLVDFASLFPPPPPVSLKQGDALFEAGKTLYDNLDTEAAVKKLTEAAAFYERYAVDTKPERLGRVYIFLGASRLLNGDVAGAQASFARALLTAPDIQPESELFGQEVHDAFNAAKVGLSRQPKGTLAIDSVPSGAQVLLHGQSVGTTPVKDVELAPGPHQVVLTLPGYAPFGAFQDVPPSQRTALRPMLEPTPGLASVQDLAANASAKPLDAEPLPPEVAALGERLGARYVVLAVVRQGRGERVKATLNAWDVQVKSRLLGVGLRPEDARDREEAVEKVHAFVTGKLVPSPSPLPLALPAVVKKPWFWAAVGGVAAATTASILLASQPNKPPLGVRLGNPGAGW